MFPIARGLTANWKVGNRREAGAALAHIVGSGSEANHLLANMSRILKKVGFSLSTKFLARFHLFEYDLTTDKFIPFPS